MANRTRLFNLTWDNSKIPNLAPTERFRPRDAEGTHYTRGLVTLDNGVVFESMHEMERSLGVYGKYTVTYRDEEVSVEQQQPA